MTCAEAKKRGLKHYFTGKSCKHGHVDLRSVTGGECYECRRSRNRDWHADNLEYAKERRQRFHDSNPTYFQDYRERKPEVQRSANLRWKKNHPEKNTAKVLEYQKRYPEKIRAKRRQRRKDDPAFRIRTNLASRLAMAVRNGASRKSAKTMELVGCSIQELMVYLESKFLPGMSWESYGLGQDKWHVDHIRACASFDLTDAAQQCECFHYTNLQPLWQPDNFRKGSRLDVCTSTT